MQRNAEYIGCLDGYIVKQHFAHPRDEPIKRAYAYTGSLGIHAYQADVGRTIHACSDQQVGGVQGIVHEYLGA